MESAPAANPGDQAPDLQVRIDPAVAAGADMLRDQVGQADPGLRGPSPEPGRHATRDSGHRRIRVSSQGYATTALDRCRLELGDGSVNTPIVPVQRVFSVFGHVRKHPTCRCIEA
jgi:hypothetical protein